MAININVQVARSVARENNEGLTLVVFQNARRAAGVTDTIVQLNTLNDLYTKLEAPQDDASAFELYVAEYLLRADVNLLAYTTGTVGDIDSDDIDAISDLEVLNYKMLVAPYLFVDTATPSDGPAALLMDFAKDNDVQLFLDLDPNLTTTEATTLTDNFSSSLSPKLELYINSGLPTFTSNYTTLIPSDFDDANSFYGIPSSAVAVAKKARLLLSGTPWLPIAGEVYGLVSEFTALYRALSTAEKTAFQAENFNVLFTKVGVGNLFVSQNTMVDTSVLSNPLRRSHVVTEALYIKRLLRREAERLLYAPNNIKTWNQFALKARSLFKKLLDLEGIEDFSVQVGRGVTMTNQDITDGKFKAVVTFLPIRVIEDITFNIVIQENEDAYVVDFEGGDL